LLVSDLTHLLESGEYRRCLDEALVLLERGGHDGESEARIQAAICRSRLELTDYFGAVQAGEVAVDLAGGAAAFDLLGLALVDLGTAYAQIHRPSQAIAVFQRYLSELTFFTAARCMEGTVLRRLASALQQHGRSGEALERLWEAHEWFERYGDEKSAVDCRRAAIRVYLEQAQSQSALALIREGDRYSETHPWDRDLLVAHMLDRALFCMVTGRHEDSIQEAFRALEAAGSETLQVCEAQLILSQNALALNQPKDALNFALAARVTAIDGRYYDLEFEASDILFQLLRERGGQLVRELETDYQEQGVDVYHYLSDRVIRRYLRKH